jgi:hypothetical protein
MQLWQAGSLFGSQNTVLPNIAFLVRPFVEHLSRACGTILSFRAASLIEVVQGGSPPLRDISGAIDVHPELPQDISPQITLRIRSVDQQHSLPFACIGNGRGER